MRHGIAVACAAVGLLAGCSHAPVRQGGASRQPGPQPVQSLRGHYVLSKYDGQSLPVSISRHGHCVTQLDSARLDLNGVGFQLGESLSSRCHGELHSRTLKRVTGSYRAHAGHVTLKADHGRLFHRASGRVHKHRLILTVPDAKKRSHSIQWLFVRRPHSPAHGQTTAQTQ